VHDDDIGEDDNDDKAIVDFKLVDNNVRIDKNLIFGLIIDTFFLDCLLYDDGNNETIDLDNCLLLIDLNIIFLLNK
jgi:hypothetical protein